MRVQLAAILYIGVPRLTFADSPELAYRTIDFRDFLKATPVRRRSLRLCLVERSKNAFHLRPVPCRDRSPRAVVSIVYMVGLNEDGFGRVPSPQNARAGFARIPTTELSPFHGANEGPNPPGNAHCFKELLGFLEVVIVGHRRSRVIRNRRSEVKEFLCVCG
jgi:hypothetical protein